MKIYQADHVKVSNLDTLFCLFTATYRLNTLSSFALGNQLLFDMVYISILYHILLYLFFDTNLIPFLIPKL